jgi:hypothetical protein
MSSCRLCEAYSRKRTYRQSFRQTDHFHTADNPSRILLHIRMSLLKNCFRIDNQNIPVDLDRLEDKERASNDIY